MGADYGTGFSVGKAKAHFEVRHWSPGEHSNDCGCEVCKTVQTVLLKVFGPDEMGVVSAEMASRGDDLRELIAALMTYHLRRAGKLDAAEIT